MKNFIESGSANCIKVIGYSPACKTCNNAKKRFSIKNNLPIFYIDFKDPSRKLVSYYYKVLSSFILLFINIPAIKAQHGLSYALRANIISRLTKYIDWPGYNNSGDLVIGIVGDILLYYDLEDFIANKTGGNTKIDTANINGKR